MTDTDELKPGWYWVRRYPSEHWEVAQFEGGVSWWYAGIPWSSASPAIIGPRLTPPGEG